MRLFWVHGYDGTSIADLTEAMGITPQSLYSAFGSKSGLYQRALIRYGETAGSGRAEALALPNAVDSLVALLSAMADQFSRRTFPHGCMISTGELRTSESPLAEQLSGIRTASLKMIEGKLRDGVRAGEVRPDVDVPSLARFVSTVIQGLAVQAADGASRAALRAVAEQASIVLEAARG